MNKTKSLVLLLALFLLVAGFGWLSQQNNAKIDHIETQNQLQDLLESAVLMDAEQGLLPEFSLLDHDGQTFDNQRLTGHWSLLFFGYTHCPDVCPTELYRLSVLMESMQKKQIKPLPEVVFVSLDALRDTPESMKKYTGHFHKRFLGVTGEQVAVDALAQYFEVMYETVYYKGSRLVKLEKGDEIPADKTNSYLINHSAWIYVINPEGHLFAVFPSPHEDEILLRDWSHLSQAL